MSEKKLEDVINKHFDKTYLLTMVNRKDRQNSICNQFKYFNISLPDETNKIRYFYGTSFPYNHIITDAFNKTGSGRFSKANEYDCARNHYAMVKICYELGYKNCLIIEDDVLFLKDENKIIDYIESLPEDYDIAQFGGFTADPMIQEYINNSDEKWLKHKKVGVWNCSMYALSRKGMEFFIAFMDKIFWVADGPLYKAPINDKLVNTYICREPLVIQADKNLVSSDIRNSENDDIDYNTQNMYEKNIKLSDYCIFS